MRALCCIGLSLLLAGGAFSQRRIEDMTDEEAAYLKDRLKDPGTLKGFLEDNFSGNHSIWPDEITLFKRKFGLADDTLRGILTDICHETARKTEWRPFQDGDPEETLFNKRRLSRSIKWLGYCADEPTKDFLMEVATDGTKAWDYRAAATVAYIQCADANQVRDAIARFFIDVEEGRYAPDASTFQVYDDSEGDPQKREAIVASLIVALAREGDKNIFSCRDKQLAERSREYATSAQRLDMLKRMSKLPPSKARDTDPDLKKALAAFRFRFFKTNVSTNLTELMARDFGKPE